MVDAHLTVEGVAAVLSSRPGVCIIICEGCGAAILPALGFGTKESVVWRTAPSNSKVFVDCFILSFNLLCLDSEKNQIEVFLNSEFCSINIVSFGLIYFVSRPMCWLKSTFSIVDRDVVC